MLLRSKGIPSALLEEWRQQALTGLRGTQQIGATVAGSKRIKDLEREVAGCSVSVAMTGAMSHVAGMLREVFSMSRRVAR